MNGEIPVLKAREILRILERAGFYIHHQTGSHAQLKHRQNPILRITVPVHNKDVPKQILRSILKQAQMSIKEFNVFR